MAWRDNLQKASFRGVPFKVFGADTSVGRRSVLHEYPFRDEPYVEDLGQAADEFNVEGFVVQSVVNGWDYFRERNALIDALRKEGPGTLIHPFFGTLTVALKSPARVSERIDNDGGVACFAMLFVQAGKNQFPGQSPNPISAVDGAADTALAAGLKNFASSYRVSGFPDPVAARAQADVSVMFGMMKRSLGSIQGAQTSLLSQAYAGINTSVAGLGTSALSPTLLGTTIAGGFTNFLNVSGAAVNGALVQGGINSSLNLSSMQIPGSLGRYSVAAALKMCSFGQSTGTVSRFGGLLTPISPTTPQAIQQIVNRTAIVNLARNTALMTAARIAVRVQHGSYNGAVSLMKQVSNQFDGQLITLGGVVQS
ncbi:MAG: hypothetical protein C4575_09315 [Desulforudis sp.]|nr:MAG: hypothetical protein C4575_09315 [Desulforudis sp.]